jgi:peptide/nickel transport system ATP-binding protein
MSLLSVEDLSVSYGTAGADAVRHVSFALEKGEFVGLVGESGSGKSTLGYALTSLLRPPAHISSGRVVFDGVDIASLDREAVRRQRRGGFAMVLQSGMNALNPVRTIGHHFDDVFRAHGHVPKSRFDSRATELLERVGLDRSLLKRYPDELSGGMRQRASIAIALSLEPRLLVFDEPTTALDVLVQAEVMETIRELQASEGFTALLISHDLGLVLESTQRVLVMHEGEIVEDTPSQSILENPSNPYTRMLLSHYVDPQAETVELPGVRSSASTAAGARSVSRSKAIVVTGVSKTYRRTRFGMPAVPALEGIDLTLEPGQSLAVVGASGSGKSTLARIITGIEQPTTGTVEFGDRRVDGRRGQDRRSLHRDIQMVFQDPYAALNPVHTVGSTVSRPLVNYLGLHGSELKERVLEVLRSVGLDPAEEYAERLPHELSGGQRQRVVIARALACQPSVIVADEPVSMLDVSLRAGILALLQGLRETQGVSMLYITHDLLSARVVSDDMIVLEHGHIVERGATAEVMRHPTHDYTQRLLQAAPNPWKRPVR